MIERAESAYGRLDVLFNNAGISHIDDGDAVDTDEDVWDLTMQVNLKGVFLCCKHGIPLCAKPAAALLLTPRPLSPYSAPLRRRLPIRRAREAYWR